MMMKSNRMETSKPNGPDDKTIAAENKTRKRRRGNRQSPNVLRVDAAIFKQRCQIELFFKAINQNLRIKTSVGPGANAGSIQIWSALITNLLVKDLQFKSRCAWGAPTSRNFECGTAIALRVQSRGNPFQFVSGPCFDFVKIS